MKELPVPPKALGDDRAREIARTCAAGGQMHVSLATGLWEDPRAWGLMLVDLAKHVSRAYEETTARKADEVLLEIRKGFDAEWGHETGSPVGGIVEE